MSEREQNEKEGKQRNYEYLTREGKGRAWIARRT